MTGLRPTRRGRRVIIGLLLTISTMLYLYAQTMPDECRTRAGHYINCDTQLEGATP